MSDLIPNLIKCSVEPEKLILDPNNPRLITRDDDIFEEAEALDRHDNTIYKMRDIEGKDSYRIKELESSIKQNGWWPIDFIFVKKFDDKRYIVLEGNRRVTAIRNIRNDSNADPKLKEKLDTIEVMEITDDCSSEILKKKITYLLGVRHHGSLKKWTPFAQANNIYKRYLELADCSVEKFKYDPDVAQQVANALSIDSNEVIERLKVFRAMECLGKNKKIMNSEGGIKDRYYSVCAEVLLTKNKNLRKYIDQHENNYLIDEESIDRFNNLCHFDKKNRDGAPISNPQEWRKFANILGDEDPTKKQEMVNKVEIDKEKPSIVWAQRSAELKTPQWDKWLNEVNSVIRQVTLGDDLNSEYAIKTTKRLIGLLDELDKKKGDNNA
jgi:hypothetical protein